MNPPLAPKNPIPFASVIVRTQGIRMITLSQTIESLLNQKSKNFEIIIVAHKVPNNKFNEIMMYIEGIKTNTTIEFILLNCTDGERGQPINIAMEHAKGEYAICLDDDDVALPDWISAFEEYAIMYPQAILRAQTGNFYADEQLPERPISITTPYAPSFNFIEHLNGNSSPLMSLAYPLKRIRELHLKFDKSLQVLEDWDFLMRAAMQIEVISIPVITSLYRKWSEREKCSYVHAHEVWLETEQKIIDAFDSGFITLPPSSTKQLRNLVKDLNLAKSLLLT